MNGLGTLFVGIAALISSLVSAGALLVSVRRGSDRENQRAAHAALEVVQDAENVVVIEREADADER